MTVFEQIARDPGRPDARVREILEAIRDFDASASEMLCRIEADMVEAVSAGRWDTVELLSFERRSHRLTREVMLAAAEASVRRVDAQAIWAELVAGVTK